MATTYTILVSANAAPALSSAGAVVNAFGNVSQSAQGAGSNIRSAFEAMAGGAKTLLLTLAAVTAAFAGFSLAAILKEGFRFNALLEQTKLSIASLIAAFDRTEGRSVGERLSVGLTIAQDQLKKLRVDALTTSATFEELAAGFQTAIGTGLGKGLDLNQIRTLTLQIGQAAKVFGLASNQITSEIKDILSGNITRNSTIATSLGITREDIKKYQDNAGELFKFLQDKLGSFRQAGVIAATTFGGLISNAQEAFTTLAAAATEKTFEASKTRLARILGSVFDLKNSGLDKGLQPIVDLFDRIGVKVVNGLGDAVEFVVGKVKEFGKLLEENPDLVDRIVFRFEELVSLVTDLFKGVLSAFDPSNGRDFLFQIERALVVTQKIVEVLGTAAQIFAVVSAGTGEIFRAVFFGGEQDYEKILARRELAERARLAERERQRREEEAKNQALPTIQVEKKKDNDVLDLEKKIEEARKLRDVLRNGGGQLFDLEQEKDALGEETKQLREILQLRRQLGINEGQRISESLEAQKDEIEALQKIKAARAAIVELSRAQANAEIAVAQAAAASLVPVVDAQTRADQRYFESIRQRKDAEADLQATIIQQLRERGDLEAQASRDRATQLSAFQEQLNESDRIRQDFIATATRLALRSGDAGLFGDLRAAANKPPVVPQKIDTTNSLLGQINDTVKQIATHTESGLKPLERAQLADAGVRVNRADRGGNAFVGSGSASGNLRAFLDTIAYAEGTDRAGTGGGYNVKVGGKTFSDLSRKDTSVVRLSASLSSSAAGRYQFLNKTWAELQATLGLPDFGPDSQDRAAMELIRRAGAIPDIEAGNFDVAARKVRKIWASFPGAGYGQPELALGKLRSVFASRLGANGGAGGNNGSFIFQALSDIANGRVPIEEESAGNVFTRTTGRNLRRAVISPVEADAGFTPITGIPESQSFVRNLDGSRFNPNAASDALAQRFFGRNASELTESQAKAATQRAREIEDTRILLDDNEALFEIDRKRLTEIIAFNSKLDEQAQRRRVEIDQVEERARLEERLRKLQSGDPLTERDLRQTYDNSVLAERVNLLEQNKRLEFEIGDAGVNSAERLRNAYLTATKARVDAEQIAAEQIIRTQVELADKYTYSQTQTTALILDNINRGTKSLSQIAADFQTGVLDAIVGQAGTLIDKFTAKLGFLGGVVGNLLKELAKLALNKIFLSLLGLNGQGGGAGGSGGGFGGIIGSILGGKSGPTGTPSFAGGAGAAGGGLGGAIGALLGFGKVQGTPTFAGGGAGVGGAGGGVLGALLGGGKGVGGLLEKLTGGAGGLGDFKNATDPSSTITGSIGGLAGKIIGGALSKTIGGGAGSLLKAGAFGGKFAGLGGLAPLLGLQVGGQIGGGLGAIGGLLLGGSAFAGLAGAAGISGLLTGVGVSAGASAGIAAGAAAFLTNPFTIAIGAALLIGGFFLSRAKQRKRDEVERDRILGDVNKQLDSLLDGVKRNKIDGKSAVEQTVSIRAQYLEAIAALKTKSVRDSATRNQLPGVDRKIADIKAAADRQDRNREVAENLIPSFNGGGSIRARLAGGSAVGSIRPTAYASDFFRKESGLITRGRGWPIDDVPILAAKDEAVINPIQIAKLGGPKAMRRAGVPGFSGGGAVDPSVGGATLGGGNLYLQITVEQGTGFAGQVVSAGLKDEYGRSSAMKVIVEGLKEGS